jgi:hypothetical protein
MRRVMRCAGAVALLAAAACSAADQLPPGSEPTELVYTAETSVAESFPVQLFTTVRVHNPTAEAVTLTSPDGCVVSQMVHRTADRAGAPAWRFRGPCSMAIKHFTIDPGATLEVSGHAHAGAILGDSLPDGRYYISANVRFEGGHDLPAGEADLAN